MVNIVGKRYWYFALSLLIMLPGLIGIGIWGLPLSIDFSGGSKLEVRYPKAEGTIQPEDVKTVLDSVGFGDSIVQTSENNTVIIRTKTLDEASQTKVLEAMKAKYGEVTVLRIDNVGPTVGAEVTRNAAIAVGLAAIGILLYITYAFWGIPHAFRYGVCAIAAMLHDVLVVIGISSIFGKFLGWEIDSLFLTALLTVIGFSVHDTIVVFDRVRENQRLHRRATYESLINHSIIQTLDRSFNTQLTIVFTLVALALFGGVTIQHFIVTLLVGMISGTYSSIFNAAPLLVVWENQEWGRFFGRGSEAAA